VFCGWSFSGQLRSSLLVDLLVGCSGRAGIKNLRLNTMLRIEFCEPIESPPYFAAFTLSFLEPLSPEFQLQLSSVMVPDAIADTVTKPVLMRVLENAVFSVCTPWNCSSSYGTSWQSCEGSLNA
jgi:hypothetical protein